jgi:transposase
MYHPMSKNTVKTYLLKLYQLKMCVDDLLLLDDPELEKKFHEGNPAYKDPRFEYIKEHLDVYRKDLENVGGNKRLLWEEYRQSCLGGYGYTQFCHYLNQQLVARKPVTKANRYDPDINRALEDCCNHYGITILPTRLASPQDKALVENQVKLRGMYRSWQALAETRRLHDLSFA